MTTYIVSSGSTLSGVTLHSGDVEYVYSGGSAVDTTINSGGIAYVDHGGSAISATVASGGEEFVFSGGSASIADVSSGGIVVVLPGGSVTVTSAAAGALVLSTGVVFGSNGYVVSAAPTLTSVTVGPNDDELVLPGGSAVSTTVSEGVQYVFSGGVASGATVVDYGSQTVFVGGLAAATSVSSSGTETVESSGTASGTAVGSGGRVVVNSAGSAIAGTIGSAGFEIISSGGTVSGTEAASGGTLVVLPGAVASDNTAAPGGVVASTGIVLLSGTELVSSANGTVSGLVVSGIESAIVLPGGATISALLSGGTLELFSATASFTQVSGYGSEEVENGGTASFTTVSAGYQFISSGGVASGTTLLSAGYQDVLSGGNAVSAVVSGEQAVEGTASFATLIDGRQTVLSGGVATGTVLSSGSYEVVSVGGSAAGTTIGSGGLAYVYSGGTASGTHVESGGVLVVLPHGSATGTTVDSGGLVITSGVAVLSGTSVVTDVPAVLSGNVVSAGQVELVLPQGSALSAVIDYGALYDYSHASGTVVSGGDLMVTGSGVTTGTTVDGGTDYILSGGSAVSTTVSAGYEDISAGGVASGTTLTGGDQFVFSGGSAAATSVGSGSYQIVSSGGSATGTSVGSGGIEYVDALAVASGTAVGSGGNLYVFSAGAASGAVISAGGVGWVSSGGLAAGPDVKSGGLLIVMPGGSVTNPDVEAGGVLASAGVLVLSGTTVVSSASTTVSGAVVTSGETELVLPGGSAVSAVISNGGTDDVYSGGTTSGAVVHSGAFQSLSGGSASFETISGGTVNISAGGLAVSTTITSGTVFVASGGTTSATTVGSGANEYTDGGTASGTTVQAGGTQYVDAGTAIDTTVSAGGSQVVLGTSISAVLLSGANADVYYVGTADGTTIDIGATETVAGVASDTVLDGGTEIVSGGVETGGTIGAGGYLYDEAASDATSNVTIGSGGFEFVYSGATASGTDVQSGGTLIVLPGGSATSTTVATGGTVISTGVLILSSSRLVSAASGTLSNVVVSANEQEIVLPQGATESSILGSGGVEEVDSGGVASFTTVSNGGSGFVYAGGTAEFTTVSSGGTEVVSSGGVASATTLDNGGSQYVSSGGTASATLVSSGTGTTGESVENGGTAIATTVENYGEQFVFSGGVVSSSVASGNGSVFVENGGVASDTTILSGGFETIVGSAIGTTIEAGGFEEFYYGGGVATDTVVSSGGSELLEDSGIGSGTTILSGGKEVVEGGTATDTTLLPGGTIELEEFTYSSGGSVSLNSSTDVLTVITGGQTYTQQMAGDYSGEIFHLAPDPVLAIAPDVTLTPCYCRGTHIATPQGQIPVEALRIGDTVLTAEGQPRAIRWIGRRSYDGRFAAGNHHLLPVLVRQGALAENVPVRDLYVSPNHALYLDGLLIPAIELVNGGAIVQLETVDKVEYFHVELDAHDILLAEGAPAESFVDDQSRGMFHNAQEYAALYPNAAAGPAAYCAPRVEAGEELQAVRARLAARAPAGSEPATVLPAPLTGYLDAVEPGRITGWACNPDALDERVRIAILDNGVVIAELLADRYRADLADAGMGDGRYAFALTLPQPLDPLVRHVVQARRAGDGRELGLSPRIIEPVAADTPPEPMEPEPPVALPQPPEPSRPWEGYLDNATREQLRGWAREPDADEPVSLLVLDNGKQIARVVANMYRVDLDRAGIGRGRHGFDLLIPGGLSPLARHVVEIRRESDGAMLRGAPAVIEPETNFGAALERAVTRAVDAVADGERERVLMFLAEQADRLRQLRADTEGQRHAREAARRLRRRWGPDAERHGLAEPGQRALVIDARVPQPDRDAGSQALLSHMRALGRLGYEVSFVAADEMARTDANALGEGVSCCRAPFYGSVEEVLRRQVDCFDVVYMHRATIAQRYLPLVRQHMPRARVLYSVADLHWLRLERQAAAEDMPELLPESRRLRFVECTAAWMADAVITHSAHEAAVLRAAVPAARVHCVPWEVPAQPTGRAFAERRGIAFIGHYGHVPNQDAAYWLVQDIMPRVWQNDPDIECLLVGSDMPEAIRALARPGVRVLGHVDDLAPIHAEVRLTAATLRYGAGVKGKVLNSFAAGVPCVMSPMAAEGLALPPPLDRLVGSDPAMLAALICRLHADEAAHAVAVRVGLGFIRDRHGAAAVDAALRASIADNAPRVRPAAPARASSAAG